MRKQRRSERSSEVSAICRSLSSDLQKSLHSAGHRSWRNTPASSSKQAARATPKGSRNLLCAGDAAHVTAVYKKRGSFIWNFLVWNGVRWARLELAQDYSHYPLKVACLPFHHHRFVLGLQRYEQILNFQIFLQKFLTFFKFSAIEANTGPWIPMQPRLYYIGNWSNQRKT